MPRKARRVDSQDSRGAAVGRKRGASSQRPDDSQDLPRKRKTPQRRKSKQQMTAVGPGSLRDFVPFSALQDSNFAEDQSMTDPDYGNNRLKSGFRRGVQGDSATYLRGPNGSEEDGEVFSDSQPIVYEIDSTDDEGGITLNVEEKNHEPIVISDDEAGARGSKQRAQPQDVVSSAVDQPMPTVNDISNQTVVDEGGKQDENFSSSFAFVIDTSSTKQQLCLKNLKLDQLEEQLKYAFWHLHRDQIDLNRPVRCLHCQDEGHINEQCPEKTCKHCGKIGAHNSNLCPEVERCSTCRQTCHSHCDGMKNNTVPCDICSKPGHVEQECEMRHSVRVSKAPTEKLELWISCCYCASKSHLIGDCPTARAPSSSTARWSLRALNPEQITNLSIQKGMDKLELDARNRGMRPEGMKIRGRASRHNADASRHDADDSDDLATFLHHPPSRRDEWRQPPRIPASTYRPGEAPGYGRPNWSDIYRPPRNAFYATDSFGRNRSRSPPPPRQPQQRRWRSPSTDGSSYRPADSWPPSRQSSPPRTRGLDNSQRPGPGISIQLPTRKGSNPNLANPSNSRPHKKRKARHRGGAPPR